MYTDRVQAPVGELSLVRCASSSKPAAPRRIDWRRTMLPRESVMMASSGTPSSGCAQSEARTIRPNFISSPGR